MSSGKATSFFDTLDGLAEEEAPVETAPPPQVEDSDEDDLPPPLEAASSVPKKPAQESKAADLPSVQELAASTASGDGEKNEAASALMDKAIAQRKQKQEEAERERKSADLSSGGLKKGFLSSKPKKASGTGEATKKATSKPPEEEVPYISGAPSAQAAREASLKLPEVQQAIKQATSNLQDDKSWVTPQLIQAMGSRPDLMQGMSNPKIQAAIQLMQTDPVAAQQRYKDDAEVSKFLTEFSGLMATHFDVLGSSSKASSKAPAAQQAPPTSTSSTSTSQQSSGPVVLPPEVQAVLKDPEVKQLLNAAQAGMPLEIHALGQSNPRLFHKIKVLLDAGLLSMHT
mmetsp:Transcript_74056/g.176336  ORF Transcript_74056/g.176336 Transcript_74056/m.176336 type:complete len:343 (-) Transcript_74056:287-1315(-)